MTPRVRVLTAVARRPADRTPADYKAEPDVNRYMMDYQFGVAEFRADGIGSGSFRIRDNENRQEEENHTNQIIAAPPDRRGHRPGGYQELTTRRPISPHAGISLRPLRRPF